MNQEQTDALRVTLDADLVRWACAPGRIEWEPRPDCARGAGCVQVVATCQRCGARWHGHHVWAIKQWSRYSRRFRWAARLAHRLALACDHGARWDAIEDLASLGMSHIINKSEAP